MIRIGKYCKLCAQTCKVNKRIYIPPTEEEAPEPLCPILDPLRNAPHGVAYIKVIVDEKGNYASINMFSVDQQEVFSILVNHIERQRENTNNLEAKVHELTKKMLEKEFPVP